MKKFTESVTEGLENEPYIHMLFNMNLRGGDNPEGILKSPPIKGIKNLKRWFMIINQTNLILKMTAGKNIYIEKHNFETMEDLDRWLENHPE